MEQDKRPEIDLSILDAGTRTSIEKIVTLYTEAEKRRLDLYEQHGIALEFTRDSHVLTGSSPTRLYSVRFGETTSAFRLDRSGPVDPISGMHKVEIRR